MISRRELLMWAGLSTTNLLGTGCSPARVTSRAPARFMQGHGELDAPVLSAFILSVDSSGLIHVGHAKGRASVSSSPLHPTQRCGTDRVRSSPTLVVSPSIQHSSSPTFLPHYNPSPAIHCITLNPWTILMLWI